MDQAKKRGASKRGCAICGRPAEPRFKPFCSHRCQDVDLARWLNGVYVLPTDEQPETGDDVVVPFPARGER